MDSRYLFESMRLDEVSKRSRTPIDKYHYSNQRGINRTFTITCEPNGEYIDIDIQSNTGESEFYELQKYETVGKCLENFIRRYL